MIYIYRSYIHIYIYIDIYIDIYPYIYIYIVLHNHIYIYTHEISRDFIQQFAVRISQDYGVRHILGITAGYNGLSDPVSHPPIELTEKMVRHLSCPPWPWHGEMFHDFFPMIHMFFGLKNSDQ